MKWIKRISQLSENVIRVECLQEHQKNVTPTFAIRHPEKFKPMKTKKVGKVETFSNKFFSIKFLQDEKKFSPKNLYVEWTKGNKKYLWRPGRKDKENLGGSFFSLDLCQGKLIPTNICPYDPMKGYESYSYGPFTLAQALLKEFRAKYGNDWSDPEWIKEFDNLIDGRPPKMINKWTPEILKILKLIRQYPPGYLSRSGICIFLDNSFSYNLKKDWIEKDSKVGNSRDCSLPQVLYFIYYGNDYKMGISLLTELLGAVPKVPEWVMGIWFSCWNKWGEKEFHQIKENFDKYDVPLDVIVVDTDWHKYYWHGFDWNKKLFPNPERFGKWLRKNNLHSAFNVHPQYIPEKDSRLKKYLEVTKTFLKLLDAKTAPHRVQRGCQQIDLLDKKQALAYFDVFHKPVEKCGCDIWWVDGTMRDESGQESIAWLNEIYSKYTNQSPESHAELVSASNEIPKQACPEEILNQVQNDISRRDTKIILSRGYGPGTHRSIILFTADAYSQWKVLELEVNMTAKAANCLFTYVSHDIGGFNSGSPDWKINKPSDDLYIRWSQFGALSPIMRYHSHHGIREPWKYKKQTLNIVRNFLHFRKCLMPYLMRLVQETNKKGIAICRPMYYEFPEEENAYRFENQYMLGDVILVSPVTRENGVVTTWFPKGKWYHCFTERVVEGPNIIEEKVPLELMPVYVREGHTIPYRQKSPKKDKNKFIYQYTPEKIPLIIRMGIK